MSAGPTTATEVTYHERLWPGWWVWLLAVGMVGSLAIAYGTFLGALVGWVVMAVGLLLALALMRAMASPIVVSAQGLRAGRATLPWQFVGQVLALDGEHARKARGPDGDPSAYLLLRAGVGPGAVVVEVTDPEDPHHTWLLATRRPQVLADAIEAARGRLTP